MRYGFLYFTLSFTKRNYMEEVKNEDVLVDVRDLITEHLKADDRSLMWLHEKTKIPYGTLYSCFTQRLFKVKEENLIKINEVLGTDFK